LLSGLLALGSSTAVAQLGGGGMSNLPGAEFGAVLTRFLGEHTAFMASVNLGTKSEQGNMVLVPGKLAYLGGQTRFDVDISKVEGSRMPPIMAEQIKAVGMSDVVMITRPDKKLSYMQYPGLKAYAEIPLREESNPETAKKSTVEKTKLGEETLAGFACTKYRVVVTDEQGKTHEGITWNAHDLRGFPIVIETSQKGSKVTLLFSEVKFGNPPSSTFEPSRDYQKYEDVKSMMREAMMKLLGGGVPK
jgi:hypothetical protein